MAHWSSCPVHNAPALPAGECDCGDDAPEPELNGRPPHGSADKYDTPLATEE